MAQQASKGPRRADLEPKLIERAKKDPEFRKKLLADPKKVIEAELGRSLPDHVKIRALQETPNELYLVIPAVPQESGRALEGISGGIGVDFYVF